MNHFLIGLGGAGGRTIRALRHQIRSERRAGDPGDAKLAYLYLDSSAEMMAASDPSWQILGRSIQLAPAEQLKTGGRDLVARLDSLDFSGIKPWLGDKDVWADILGSVAGGSLSGQKRRLGRFLFACHADQFRAKVQTQVGELQAGGARAVTFHVVAGLAGGTGSGAIVDAVAQLRTMFKNTADYRILLYLLLPEKRPDPKWDVGNYHANGYAALVELNAMSVSALQPWNVAGGGDRLALAEPFAGAYLISNEKDNGDRADIDRPLPDLAANFLFQKIFVAGKTGRNPLERMERAEHGSGTPELSPTTREAERSRRFLSFGITRVAIPEEEIADYLSFSFASQAIRQLQFNNWQDGAGFVDRPGHADAAAYVRQPDVRDRWRIGDEYINLATAILPSDDPAKRWKPFEEEWSTVITAIKTVVQDQKQTLWLSEMARLIEKRFSEDYRGCGVEAFYRAKLETKQDMAREIRSLIERELFGDWSKGRRSITEVGAIIDAVLDDLAARQALCDGQAADLHRKFRDHANTVEDTWQQWLHTNIVSKAIFGTSHRLLDECTTHLVQKRTAQTRALACGFAKELLGDILLELGDLKTATAALAEDLRDASAHVQTELDDRLREQGPDDQSPGVARFHDARAVKATVHKLSVDANVQLAQTAALRRAITSRLDAGKMFEAFRAGLHGTALADLILVSAEANALQAHQAVLASSRERILGVSIIERLKARYGGNQQALDGFVADLVGRSGVLLRWDPVEIGKPKSGLAGSDQMRPTKWIVTLPKAPADEAFVTRLKQAFTQARPNDIEFIETPDRGHEITIMSVRSLFPARHAAIVAMLRDRYRQRIAEDPRRFAQELHTEGDGTQLPDLFVTTYQVIDGGKHMIRQLRGA